MFQKLLCVSLFAFNFLYGLGKFYDVNLYVQSTYWEKVGEWQWDPSTDETKKNSILQELRGKFLINTKKTPIEDPKNSFLFLGLTQTNMIFPVKNKKNIVGFAQIAQDNPQYAYYTSQDVENKLPYAAQTNAYKKQNNITSYPQAYIFFRFNAQGKCTRIIASGDRNDAKYLVFE
jgi:hypothetical protein